MQNPLFTIFLFCSDALACLEFSEYFLTRYSLALFEMAQVTATATGTAAVWAEARAKARARVTAMAVVMAVATAATRRVWQQQQWLQLGGG